MVLRLSLLIFIPQQKPWSSKNSAESPLQRRRRHPPPPPSSWGIGAFKRQKITPKKLYQKKHLFYLNYIKLVRAKKKLLFSYSFHRK